MNDEPYFYHPLENIEDIDEFEAAVERTQFNKALSPERPYTYWTLELYDQENGIRGRADGRAVCFDYAILSE